MLGVALAAAQPKRVLYVTHSAGFRHSCLELSQRVMAALSPDIEVTATEDLSLLTADRLRDFDAVFFYTSGELALSGQQKQDLLAFVRSGQGFGGAHSATDTLYQWPEYGDLIGAYFDLHPWVQEAGIDVEDPYHPAVRHLGPSFRMKEEIYQMRDFSRERVRVLLTLDTRTVNLKAEGVHRTDEDFALAWVRPYGAGRVFYTALGHFEETWLDARFQQAIRGALEWLTGRVTGEAAPRAMRDVRLAPPEKISPGDVIEVYGENLTSGSTMTGLYANWPIRLAGSTVRLNGVPAPLLHASPKQLNLQVPYDLPLGDATLEIGGATARLTVTAATPRILSVLRTDSGILIYSTGLGAVRPPVTAGTLAPFDPPAETIARPLVTIGGQTATVGFSGLAPGWVGLYQVNVTLPPAAAGTVEVRLEAGGAAATASLKL